MSLDLRNIRWENLEPGRYEPGRGQDIHARAAALSFSKGPAIRRATGRKGPDFRQPDYRHLPENVEIDDIQVETLGGPESFNKTIGAISRPVDQPQSPDSESAYALSASLDSLEAESTEPEPELTLNAPEIDLAFEAIVAEITTKAAEEKVHARKPQDIVLLEHILTNALSNKSNPVSITRVRDLQRSRKDKVKEVFYETGEGGLYRVWVFQAGLQNTIRELNTYYIASRAGIPTGIPIGYKPVQDGGGIDSDIAIVGGILNHVGQSYTELLHNLQMRPDLIMNTAETIAALIADYQVKLTAAEPEFERLGVKVERFDIGKEFRQRFLAGLGIPVDQHTSTLVKAMQDLDKGTWQTRVISHNDTHTNNFLTAEHTSASGQIGSSYRHFGVIDWGDVAIDHPYGDLMDFFIHLKRITDSLPGRPEIKLSALALAHKRRFDQAGAEYGICLDPQAQGHAALVKDLEWNLLEMYDPQRTEKVGIQAKARRHLHFVQRDLQALSKVGGYGSQIGTIKRELAYILKDQKYLRN